MDAIDCVLSLATGFMDESGATPPGQVKYEWPPYFWGGFIVLVVSMLSLDLFVFHRRARAVSIREAAGWTVAWVSLALIFNTFIYFYQGRAAGFMFLVGYLVEWSLSMDNVFVFAVIFTYFAVPSEYQHRVLFWGIMGAVVMRLLFILIGAALLERFHWLIYPMGAFLVFTGIKLLGKSNEHTDMSKNLALRWARRWFAVTPGYVGKYFFVRRSEVPELAVTAPAPHVPAEPVVKNDPDGSRWMVTPLFLVLLVVETTDVVFAVDSIPAIFGITQDPFLIFSSNVFAILGLRALYFLLAGAIGMFRYLSVGLAAILCFIGVKMLISGMYHIPIGISLGIVCGTLVISVVASLIRQAADGPTVPLAESSPPSPEQPKDKVEIEA